MLTPFALQTPLELTAPHRGAPGRAVRRDGEERSARTSRARDPSETILAWSGQEDEYDPMGSLGLSKSSSECAPLKA